MSTLHPKSALTTLLICRHAALSAADAWWMENVIRDGLGKDVSLDNITIDDFKKVAGKQVGPLMATTPDKWVFGGLERGADGRFKDTDLAGIIKSCVEEPAHAFGEYKNSTSLAR